MNNLDRNIAIENRTYSPTFPNQIDFWTNNI